MFWVMRLPGWIARVMGVDGIPGASQENRLAEAAGIYAKQLDSESRFTI